MRTALNIKKAEQINENKVERVIDTVPVRDDSLGLESSRMLTAESDQPHIRSEEGQRISDEPS